MQLNHFFTEALQLIHLQEHTAKILIFLFQKRKDFLNRLLKFNKQAALSDMVKEFQFSQINQLEHKENVASGYLRT